MDDFPVTFEDLDMLRASLSEADLALGNRHLPSSVFLTSRSYVRRVTSVVFRFLVRALFGLRGFDTQCGIKAFKKTKTDTLFADQLVHGFAYDVELALRAIHSKLEIAQVPVHWKSSRKTTLRLSAAIPSMLKELGVLWWRTRGARFRGNRVEFRRHL